MRTEREQRREQKRQKKRATTREIRGKLHRGVVRERWNGDPMPETACGAHVGAKRAHGVLPDASFVWLPRRLQCESCLRAYWPDRYVKAPDDLVGRHVHSIGPFPPGERSATHEMQLWIEMFCIAVARLGHWTSVYGEHRCFHRQVSNMLHPMSVHATEYLDACRWHEHRGTKQTLLDAKLWWADAWPSEPNQRRKKPWVTASTDEILAEIERASGPLYSPAAGSLGGRRSKCSGATAAVRDIGRTIK